MPSSTPSSEDGSSGGGLWRRVLALAAGVLALTMAMIAARAVSFDAYWLFRDTPPWLAATGGSNRLIDRQTRRAKSLQALTRTYRLALIGSSTVYHGLDPADVTGPNAGSVHNLGISALMADELPTIARAVASRRPVERATIGLDYYMFSRRDPPVRLSATLNTATGRLNALIGSAIGLYAIRDSFLDEVAGSGDPGRWTRDGLRTSPPLSPELTLANDAARRRSTASYLPERGTFVRQALAALRGRHLTLYLSPVNQAQRRVMADLGVTADFELWRKDMATIAQDEGVPFLDLTAIGADATFDPATGSTDLWLDNLHYTPRLGRTVLVRLGLRDSP